MMMRWLAALAFSRPSPQLSPAGGGRGSDPSRWREPPGRARLHQRRLRARARPACLRTRLGPESAGADWRPRRRGTHTGCARRWFPLGSASWSGVALRWRKCHRGEHARPGRRGPSGRRTNGPAKGGDASVRVGRGAFEMRVADRRGVYACAVRHPAMLRRDATPAAAQPSRDVRLEGEGVGAAGVRALVGGAIGAARGNGDGEGGKKSGGVGRLGFVRAGGVRAGVGGSALCGGSVPASGSGVAWCGRIGRDVMARSRAAVPSRTAYVARTLRRQPKAVSPARASGPNVPALGTKAKRRSSNA